MLKKTLILIVLSFMFAFTVNATSPLTADQIERVIHTLKQLDPIMEQMEAEMDQSEEEADPFNSEMMNQECTMIYEYSTEAQQIIEANGFTQKTWPETAGRVLKAFASIAMEQDADTGLDEMKEALAQIEANPNLTPEQKNMMKQHMQSALQTAQIMMNAPKEDVEAVRPYYETMAEDM